MTLYGLGKDTQAWTQRDLGGGPVTYPGSFLLHFPLTSSPRSVCMRSHAHTRTHMHARNTQTTRDSLSIESGCSSTKFQPPRPALSLDGHLHLNGASEGTKASQTESKEVCIKTSQAGGSWSFAVGPVSMGQSAVPAPQRHKGPPVRSCPLLARLRP